ncbi:MAG: hypothetical protein ACO3GT_06610, partial [Candidatus Nanopelagicales bacterium]
TLSDTVFEEASRSFRHSKRLGSHCAQASENFEFSDDAFGAASDGGGFGGSTTGPELAQAETNSVVARA